MNIIATNIENRTTMTSGMAGLPETVYNYLCLLIRKLVSCRNIDKQVNMIKAHDTTFQFLIQTVGASAIIIAIATVLLRTVFHLMFVNEIIAGYITSIITFLVGYFSIQLSIKKSLKAFLLYVVGGMMVRFLCLGLVLFLLMRFTQMNMIGFVVSFFICYVGFQALEIHKIKTRRSGGRA
jgi:hypothetical protein